jgi:peptidoglycan/LPS O-acetylase OafA/YrhL
MNKLEESKRSLAPLNGLRVLASLAIFLYHSRILVQGTFHSMESTCSKIKIK